MKQCESCGIRLEKKIKSKFDARYCIHCQNQQTGELSSRQQVREGSIKAIMSFQNKSREEAEKIVDKTMTKLPRWKK